MHRSIQQALRRTHPLPKPRVAMVRVIDDTGATVGIFDLETFISHNLDGLGDADIADIRAGRPVRVGGGASPLVDIEPVSP